METRVGLGEPEDVSGRARGLELLLRLTDALCELGCMEDTQGRLLFAVVLGEQLHRQVDLRGVRQREDVMALVRVALNATGGEQALVGVVRILEGTAAGDELERLIAPVVPPATPLLLPGPLSREDENSAPLSVSLW